VSPQLGDRIAVVRWSGRAALWEGPFVFLFGLSIVWLTARIDDGTGTRPA
jgi:hypothetical protein